MVFITIMYNLYGSKESLGKEFQLVWLMMVCFMIHCGDESCACVVRLYNFVQNLYLFHTLLFFNSIQCRSGIQLSRPFS